MNYMDPDTGERVTAYLFVATMPYSQMIYVAAATSMNEKAWLSCHVNMFQFFGGTPVKIVCDNLKTGVTLHSKRGDIILNEAYLSLGEYYSVAIMPTGVKKPKQKASVKGSVGKIATAVIAKLRNDVFTSLAALNAGIRKAVKEFNDKPFQKRPGSRRSIFEMEEKPYLRTLPLIPYEVCEWSYGHKVGSNSHIWWNKGQYSVPYRYIGCKVDVKFNSHLVFIYYNRTEIGRHQILPRHMANGMRTAGAILSIADIYSPQIREKACDKALRQYHMPYYKTIYSNAKSINSEKELTAFKENNKKSGIVRGADYYRKGETTNEH